MGPFLLSPLHRGCIIYRIKIKILIIICSIYIYIYTICTCNDMYVYTAMVKGELMSMLFESFPGGMSFETFPPDVGIGKS